jgi:hypothetical protein
MPALFVGRKKGDVVKKDLVIRMAEARATRWKIKEY